MLLTISSFIAHFHPVLVHLPIGILLLASFFQLLMLSNRFSMLQPAIRVMLFWGMLSALVSCVSGYLLAQSGDYDDGLAGRHQWLGIITTIITAIIYVCHLLYVRAIVLRGLAVVLILLITITGHLGGTLTHGEGYLTEGLSSGGSSGPAIKQVANIQEANAYADLVQPLLQARCYNCHGPSKQKGKLRLDEQDFMLKGGEDGKAVVPGEPGASKMIERLLLPASDKDHMPPKEKPQLTPAEISLLHWWISTGANFTAKVKDLPVSPEVKPVLASLQLGNKAAGKEVTDVPAKTVEAGDSVLIQRLRKAGVIIIPVGQNSNYLSASFFTATGGADSLLKIMEPLKKQLIWLRLDNAKIGDAAAQDIAKFQSLTRLHLNNTLMTDAGVSQLAKLQELQSLNLVGTSVTVQGILQLKQLKNLRQLYLYQTKLGGGDWSVIRKAIPTAEIDSGNYIVPTFTTDTTQVKAP